MVMIELKDAVYDTAFGLLDEAKNSVKDTKMTLCELEDAIYDCYESSKEQDDEPEEMEYRNSYASRDYRHDKYYGMREDEEPEPRMRARSGMRMRRNRIRRAA
jgi:hypothetical protein